MPVSGGSQSIAPNGFDAITIGAVAAADVVVIDTARNALYEHPYLINSL